MSESVSPVLIINFVDPIESVKGYVVIHDLIGGLASGGMRIQDGLRVETLMALAKNMSLKQKAVGIDVGGAKSGLDMNPAHPARDEVIRRFFLAIKPYLTECYNMGPDLNTTMVELETIAKSCEIPSLKIAVGRRRGLSDAEFLKRYNLFESKLGSKTINQLRAPQAVASSAMAVLQNLEIKNSNAKVVIQGAGNMGGGLAYLLAQKNIRVVGWSDSVKAYVSESGLPVQKLLDGTKNGLLPDLQEFKTLKPDEILTLECDVLILAAISDAISLTLAPDVKARSIVEAANLALTEDVEQSFHKRGVLVVPDLIASAGGSIAVQALYKTQPEKGEDILKYVDDRILKVCQNLFSSLNIQNNSPRSILQTKV